jgi:histone deacetylase 6
MVEKLRLHTSAMRPRFVRVNQLLKQKEELGENLHLIDFEQLKIENKQLVEKTEQKNHSLFEMKKITG